MKKTVNVRLKEEVIVTKSGEGYKPSDIEEHNDAVYSELPMEDRSKAIMTRWGNIGAPRQFLSNCDIPPEFFRDSVQFKIVSQLYGDISFAGATQIIAQLRTKLASYERQDREKERTPKIESEYYVTYPELLELLVLSKMKCYYCKCGIRIMYKEIRDMKQWTLDRIDNADIHHARNCRVACLACNLQKRRRDDASFLFTKQLTVGKIDN